MSNILFTSDLHLRDSKVSAIRGFDSVEEHDESVLDMWRNSVSSKDIVYVLGDVTSGRTIEGERWMLDALRDLPGRKRLVAGNHDSVHPMTRASRRDGWKQEWLEVFESVDSLSSIKIGGRKVMLSHFPYDGPEGDHTEVNRHVEWRPADCGLWLLHGHTHREEQKVHGRQIHVGLEAWGRFVGMQEILVLMNEYEREESEAVLSSVGGGENG